MAEKVVPWNVACRDVTIFNQSYRSSSDSPLRTPGFNSNMSENPMPNGDRVLNDKFTPGDAFA